MPDSGRPTPAEGVGQPVIDHSSPLTTSVGDVVGALTMSSKSSSEEPKKKPLVRVTGDAEDLGLDSPPVETPADPVMTHKQISPTTVVMASNSVQLLDTPEGHGDGVQPLDQPTRPAREGHNLSPQPETFTICDDDDGLAVEMPSEMVLTELNDNPTLSLPSQPPKTEPKKIQRVNVFQGRSLQMVSDFTEGELLYLYKQIALLKESVSRARQRESHSVSQLYTRDCAKNGTFLLDGKSNLFDMGGPGNFSKKTVLTKVKGGVKSSITKVESRIDSIRSHWEEEMYRKGKKGLVKRIDSIRENAQSLQDRATVENMRRGIKKGLDDLRKQVSGTKKGVLGAKPSYFPKKTKKPKKPNEEGLPEIPEDFVEDEAPVATAADGSTTPTTAETGLGSTANDTTPPTETAAELTETDITKRASNEDLGEGLGMSLSEHPQSPNTQQALAAATAAEEGNNAPFSGLKPGKTTKGLLGGLKKVGKSVGKAVGATSKDKTKTAENTPTEPPSTPTTTGAAEVGLNKAFNSSNGNLSDISLNTSAVPGSSDHGTPNILNNSLTVSEDLAGIQLEIGDGEDSASKEGDEPPSNSQSISQQNFSEHIATCIEKAGHSGYNSLFPDNFSIHTHSPPYASYQKTCYLIFLENSTRTRESFRNAALYHGMKLNIFDVGTSSFSKGETLTDCIKMLVNYSAAQSVFVIRSKWEGTCRHLQLAISNKYCNPSQKKGGAESGFHLKSIVNGDSVNTSSHYTKPSFLNAGDGKHQHPSQEILDQFTFLEQNCFVRDQIHLALLGDLWHGRTAHSKVDGLRIFKKVKVDLIAPPPLAMPQYYEQKMRDEGFEVRLFDSIDTYLEQREDGGIAKIWYFTRLQLERMSQEVQRHELKLRRCVTFRKEDHMDLLEDGTRFYHPLPRDSRHPVIPFSIDDTSLNGWDRQSLNGYYARTILLALCGGKLGWDFEDSVLPEKKGIVYGPNSSSEEESTEDDAIHDISEDQVDWSTFSADDIPPTDLRCENPNCISHPDNGQREVKPFFIKNICQYCEWDLPMEEVPKFEMTA